MSDCNKEHFGVKSIYSFILYYVLLDVILCILIEVFFFSNR